MLSPHVIAAWQADRDEIGLLGSDLLPSFRLTPQPWAPAPSGAAMMQKAQQT